MTQEKDPELGKSWLQEKLARLDAIYQRFGRDGLKDAALTDVSLLLQEKQLVLRDMPRGRELMEEQKAAVRHAELQVSDLTSYLQSQLDLVSSPGLRIVRGFGGQAQQQQPSQQRGYQKRHIEHER